MAASTIQSVGQNRGHIGPDPEIMMQHPGRAFRRGGQGQGDHLSGLCSLAVPTTGTDMLVWPVAEAPFWDLIPSTHHQPAPEAGCQEQRLHDVVSKLSEHARPTTHNRYAIGPKAIFAGVFLFIAVLTPAISRAELSPESPEVKEAVARALKFLDNSLEARLGGKALVGLAYLKAGTDPDHPLIQETLEAVIEAARSADIERERHVIYSTALCIIFLVTLDPVEYRAAIETHLNRLLKLQKGHGAWGYLDGPTGDTSMTQMVVLSLWEAQHGGVQVPARVWNAVTNWLLRTQDPSGGFGYQGTDPGHFSLVKQREVRISITAGALGSLYVVMHRPQIDATRTAARSTARDNNRGKASAGRWRQSVRLGHGWWQDNFEINPLGYTYYFLYALERYQTFRQSAGDKPWPRDWYDQGAKLLIDTQNENGSWTGPGLNGPWCDTAFALLFLVRSTKQILDLTLGSGMLTGGRGLPRDPSEMQLRNGRLVGARLTASADELLRLLDDPTDPDYLAAVESFKEATIRFDDESLAPHIEQLRRLMSGKDATARAAAIRALARRRNLDDVPLLIAALEDRDPQVVMASRDGLRFISRRVQGFGLLNNATETKRRAAVANWKTWYRSLRPDAKLGE